MTLAVVIFSPKKTFARTPIAYLPFATLVYETRIGTIHLKRLQFFTIKTPTLLPPVVFFTTIRPQIWPIFDLSFPLKNADVLNERSHIVGET